MSYEEQRSIFLDVACFFRSEKLGFVSTILSTGDIDASNVINDLIDKCLVTVSDNRLEMHDLLLTMGREIGYESSIKEAGNRGRLWDQEDICRVLKYKTGTAEIIGIFLDMSNVESMKLSADVFTRMWNLKFLKFTILIVPRGVRMIVNFVSSMALIAFQMSWCMAGKRRRTQQS